MLGAFISRNNDVGGYWALGKLYKHVRASNAGEVRVDLLKSTVTPPSEQFAKMLENFRQMLARQLSRRALPVDWLTGAEIVVRFTGQKSAERPGDVFECVVVLTDDLGRQRQARESGACWIHSLFKESKSTRD